MSDNKIKMLLVDDSASMREMVSFTLKGAGYEVFKATDGVEALDFAQGDFIQPPMDQLVLADVIEM